LGGEYKKQGDEEKCISNFLLANLHGRNTCPEWQSRAEIESRDSSVGITTRLRTGWSRNQEFNHVMGKKWFSFSQLPDRFWGTPSLLANKYWGLYPRNKASGAHLIIFS
jgi:hypothetical protein